MSYDTISSWSASEKDLSIRTRIYVPKLAGYRSKSFYNLLVKHYKTKEDFKQNLFAWVDSYYDGNIRPLSTSPFLDKIRMLEYLGLVEKHPSKKYKDIVYTRVKRVDEAYQVLIGKKRVFVPYYILVEANGEGAVKVVSKKVFDYRAKKDATKFYHKDQAIKLARFIAYNLLEDLTLEKVEHKLK